MHVISEVINQGSVNLVLVGARLFTTCTANTGHGGAHAGAGTTQVKTILIDIVKEVLGIIGGRTNKHDVPGLAMECHQTRTPFLPAVG